MKLNIFVFTTGYFDVGRHSPCQPQRLGAQGNSGENPGLYQ
jgi:hypothetical protein